MDEAQRFQPQRSLPPGRVRRRDALPISDALVGFLRESGLGGKLYNWPIFRAWNQVAGPELARHARAVRFARGELLVEVNSSAHMHELTNFTGEDYRIRLNEHLGKEEVRRLQFQLKR
jgi:hypothetical protein